MNAMPERKAAVAGQFYPREPERLREAVQHYLDASEVEPAPGRVEALIVPHAGYVYSGPTAGFAFARVRGGRIRRVVLLGCSHRFAISTASVYNRGGFETPLGTFPIDVDLADAITEAIGVSSREPHLFEHSLEVQLPFLAVSLGVVPIVPVLFGAPAREWHGEAGEALARLADDETLVVISTDLSHYLREDEANSLDHATLDAVLNHDWRSFIESVRREEAQLCGASAVAAGLAYADARGATDWHLLDYRTSAAASGDYTRVVGYAALSMEQPA
jgi:AmmeMemoRadiSam system protein B